ncbi:C2H2 finger domain-containing protein [Phlyctema vagabunda]|uniref:C2H2 finger domain-containing protein n=1 Tax=Phlyctema vagabunda TaxID=108571 RepID=A0ABR4PDN4_9HELO
MDSALAADDNAREKKEGGVVDTEVYLVKTPDSERGAPLLTGETLESRSPQSPKTHGAEIQSREDSSVAGKDVEVPVTKEGGEGEGGSLSALPKLVGADVIYKENPSPAPAEVVRNGAISQPQRETQEIDTPRVDTEQAKARYLKNVRAAWGDNFQDDIPWPDPPGKTFLEDILRLIKNERVTLHEFRPGIIAIYNERTRGATNQLTGWGRYISRGDLKVFLQRRHAAQLASGEMRSHVPPAAINHQVLTAGPRQNALDRENVYAPSSTPFHRGDARLSIAGPTNNERFSTQPSNPYNGAHDTTYHREQHQQTRKLPRIQHSMEQISYTPANTYYHKPPGKLLQPAIRYANPYTGPNNQNVRITHRLNESPGQSPGQINTSSHTVRSDENPTQSPQGSPTVASKALFGKLSPLSSPQVRNTDRPLASPQHSTSSPMPGRPAVLPKCYTCENRMSAQWHPYPVTVQDSASKSFQSMEYQCDSCHLRRQGPNTEKVPPAPPSSQPTSGPASNDPAQLNPDANAGTRNHFISERPDIPLHQRTRREKWSAWQPKSVNSPQDDSGTNNNHNGTHQTTPYHSDSKPDTHQVQHHGLPSWSGPATDVRSPHGNGDDQSNPSMQMQTGAGGAAETGRLSAYEAYQAYQEMQRQPSTQPHLLPPKNAFTSSASVSASVSADMEGQRSSPPPTKELAASKRTYADIIDLTDDTLVESIERDEPAHKMSRLELPLVPAYGGHQDPVPQPPQHHQPQSFVAPNVFHHHTHYMPKTAASPVPLLPTEKLVSSIETTIEGNTGVWDLKEYDPQTIASDILRAIGQHPERPGLNDHLRNLIGRFGINNNSDLGTFNWDPVRKGFGSQPNLTMPPAIEPARSHTFIPPPAPQAASGSNGTASAGYGKFSSLTPLAPSSLRNTSGPTHSDPNHTGPPSLSRSQIIVPVGSRQPSDPPQNLERPMSKVYPPGLVSQSVSSPQVLLAPAPSSMPTITMPTPKKRGRPFSRNILPAQAPHSPGPASSPFTGPRKRGRPSYKNRRPIFVAPSTFEEFPMPKKRGRPPKKSMGDHDLAPSGRYISFLCEWKDCPAELQNLETLRAHILANHVVLGADRKFSCAWAKCSTINEGEPRHFDGSLDLEEHIEHDHLQPFAWHMGDGPRGTSLGSRSESSRRSFLEDENGRQVTPSIADQEIEKGKAKENNERRLLQKQTGSPLVVLKQIKPIEGVPTFNEADTLDEDSSV